MHRRNGLSLPLLIASALLLTTADRSAAQTTQPADVDRLALQAERDWDTGHYVEALEAAEAVLGSSSDQEYVTRIARLTGEIYYTEELTTDGALPAISASGRYVSYATTGDDAVTRIVDRQNGGRVVAELDDGYRLVFSATESTAAYLPETGIGLVSLPGGRIEPPIETEGEVRQAVFGFDGRLYAIVGTEDEADVYRYDPDAGGAGPGERLTRGGGAKTDLVPVPQYGVLAYSSGDTVHVQEIGGAAIPYPASAWVISLDGSALVLRGGGGGRSWIHRVDLANGGAPRLLFESDQPVGDLAVSPGGERVAFQLMMPENNWEIYVVETSGGDAWRVSNEAQHDWAPHFLTGTTLYALKGERRNRRIFHYDLVDGESFELFRNNTVRTVEPQTEWFASADGSAIIIRADRDGNTVSPEQGVYVTDLGRAVTRAEVQARVRAQLASERDLRERGQRMFAPIAGRVRAATSQVSRDRMSEYIAGLVSIPGRHIAEPGNAPATDWVEELFRSFGYDAPERHDFNAQNRDLQNVFVTVPGTINPELVYVVGAHFDAVRNVPGADDDATGMAVVFEAARVLRENPQPATIVFMAFNGEEAGLLGARAWVADQVDAGTRIMGFVNHEVIGWANDHRMDNTIRHNNNDLRDATHAAASLFSRLITYDSYYVRSTDAAVFHDAYGEIVTALAGFPLLGNPHYHQPTDDTRTIDMQLVAEGAKTTIATVMLMASSPAPVKDLRVERRDGSRADLAWAPSPERDVVSYTVVYGPPNNPDANTTTVTDASASLQNAPLGTVVKVRANNRDGTHGWGWAELAVE